MLRALITGITGQDGHYLAWLLHRRGYEVYGLVHERVPAADNGLPPCRLLRGDLRAPESLVAAVAESRPHEVYNLGAITSVARSFEDPVLVADVNGVGALRVLEAVRGGRHDGQPTRVYQASSSEMFGAARESPQRETTPFAPRSPYAVAKVFAHHAVVQAREVGGVFAVSGIHYNHESPYRRTDFVTRKVTAVVARIARGMPDELVLGDLDAERDWGAATDHVEAMWLALQQPEPADYVLATGVTHSVRQLVEVAFRAAGIADWERHVRQDPALFRPPEATRLVGDSSRARDQLGWQPATSFEDLVGEMVAHDLHLLDRSLDAVG